MTTEQVNELNNLVSKFRETHTEFEAEVKKYGQATIETQQKLDRLDAAVNRSEEKWQAALTQKMAAQDTAYNDRMDRLEAMLSKKAPHHAGTSADEAAAAALLRKEAFFTNLRHDSIQSSLPASQREDFSEAYPHLVKSLILGDDTKGGYLAPTEFVMEMLKDVVEYSPIRTICRNRTTSRTSITMPRRRSTAAASWTAETQTRPETQNPSFGSEEIKTHELYAMVQVSKVDLEDSMFNLEAFLGEEFTEQFGLSEGTAFITGNGTAKPEGFLSNTSIASVNSGNASLITADGFINLYHELKEAYLANSNWAMSRPTLKEVRKLKDAQGQYLWAPGIRSEGRPAELLGRPYITCPDMPSIGANTFPVAFGDFKRGYLIVDRLSMEMMMDPYTAKSTGMVELSARRRVGGQVIIAEAIKTMKIAA
jgi:HK97 family phage major capsid protein